MNKDIIICSCGLDSDPQEIFKSSVEKGDLNNALNGYLEGLTDLEIFERRGNIVATNQGFFFAFYSEDLEHA